MKHHLLKFLFIVTSILILFSWFNPQFYTKKQESIHIALVGPLTGINASNGKSYRQGIQLYLNNINKRGGIKGRQLVLDEYDDQNDCDQLATQKAHEIVKDNRALAIIGHNYSDCSIKAGEIYQKQRIPAITPSSTDVKVTANRPWYFRTIFNDELQGRFLAYYVSQVLHQNNVSIIFENTNYGQSLTEVFETTGKTLGIEIKYKWAFVQDDTASKPRLAEIVDELATKPDAGLIFLATHAQEGAELVQLIKDNKISNKIIGADSFGTHSFQSYFNNLPNEKRLPGFYTNGIYMTVPIIFDSAGESAQIFRSDYRATYQEEPNWHAAFAFDSVMIIVEAIKKSEVTGDPEHVEIDRRRIKDYLTQHINTMERAVMGITGANYFDSEGNPPFKPISMGVFRGGKIVSAPVQLQNLHRLTTVEDAKVILFDKFHMYKVNVVYTGIDVRKISEFDSNHLTYKLDFLLWFRYSGDFSPQNIQFINAIEPIELGEPIDISADANGTYQLYHVVGSFKTELLPNYYLFDQHTLSIRLRHNELTRDRLIYVTDVLGMQDEKTLTQKLKTLQVLNLASGWLIHNIRFLQTTISESTLGKPRYLNADNSGIEYSSFVMDITIKKNAFSLPTLIDSTTAKKILVISIIILLLLNFLDRTGHFLFPKTVLLLQAVAAYAILLSGETIAIDQVTNLTNTYYLQTITVITTVFDILWWVISAILLHSAIERFLWLPLEKSVERKIPNVIRSFFTFLIYLLASFSIIAFVFDQALTSLLATSGVIVMIVGLAIQINISNIFSGIALNIEHPFRVGDWVQVGENADAKVLNITWRTTRLQLRNNAVLSIPNSTVAESKIINYSYPEILQEIAINVNIDPRHTPESVKKILIDAALSCETILRKPSPFVFFSGVNDWAANYRLIVHSDNYARKSFISEEVWKRVWVHLNRAGIEFAIGQQKIHIFRGISERGKEATKPITLLCEIEIFNPFSEEDKRYLSEQMQLHHFLPNVTIVEQGQQGDSLFIIVEGIVSVQVKTSDNEDTFEVARLGAGNFFGEMALLTGAERTATVSTVTNTVIYEMTKANLMPLLQKQPEVSTLISNILAHRQMATQSQIDDKIPSEKEKQSVYENFLCRIESFFGLAKRQ